MDAVGILAHVQHQLVWLILGVACLNFGVAIAIFRLAWRGRRLHDKL